MWMRTESGTWFNTDHVKMIYIVDFPLHDANDRDFCVIANFNSHLSHEVVLSHFVSFLRAQEYLDRLMKAFDGL